MNRLFVSLIMTAYVLMGVKAQTLNVVTGNVTYAFPSSQTGSMTYQDGQTLSVMGKTFSVSDVTNMYVDNSDVTTGNSGEGIESKAVLTINDGTIVVNSYDDAINSSSHRYIKGGDITVVATDNDGLDANGNMYISGGVIRAFGTRAPECGIDANEEDGYSVYFTGGTLLTVGGGNSVPSSSESTQPYVTGSMAVTANTEITLTNGNTLLASFTVPSNYSSASGGFGNHVGGGPGGGGGGPGGGGGNSGSSFGLGGRLLPARWPNCTCPIASIAFLFCL